jgi:hypothetical protein
VAYNMAGDIAQKNKWEDSSPQKIALHAIAGYIQASAAGQNGATGALAGAANEALTKTINDAIDKALPPPPVKDPSKPTLEEKAQLRDNAQSRKALAESAAQLIGASAVALGGGSAQDVRLGASVALTADRFNRQLHVNEIKVIGTNAKGFAKGLLLSAGINREPTQNEINSAESRLLDQADRNVNSQSDLRFDGLAQKFLSTMRSNLVATGQDGLPGGGAFFFASPDQYFNTTMYADTRQTRIGQAAYKKIDQGNSGVSMPNYYYAAGIENFNKEAAQVNKATKNLLVDGALCWLTMGATCVYQGVKSIDAGIDQRNKATTRQEKEEGTANVVSGSLNVVGGGWLAKSAVKSSEVPVVSGASEGTSVPNYGKQTPGYGEVTTTLNGKPVVEGQVPNTMNPVIGANGGVGSSVNVGPWSKGITNVVENGTFTQCGNGSCVSATAQVLTNGTVTESQVVARIGEWADPLKLTGVLNDLAPGSTPWRGGYFGSSADAVTIANKGPMGAVLQAPGEAAHMVTISPVPGSPGMFRVQDTGVGKTYDVPASWIGKYVVGGVWK